MFLEWCKKPHCFELIWLFERRVISRKYYDVAAPWCYCEKSSTEGEHNLFYLCIAVIYFHLLFMLYEVHQLKRVVSVTLCVLPLH